MKQFKLILFSTILTIVFLFGAGISFVNAQAALSAPTSPSPGDGDTVVQPVTLRWSSVTFHGGVAGGYVVQVLGGGLGNTEFWST
ncbi:hypothetical protein IIC44_01250, partial [Patescibacteria group bacterium]|nr:hypothetical protein [Patescibacteria group bacterium]